MELTGNGNSSKREVGKAENVLSKPQEYTAELLPTSEEVLLWKKIEEADLPIRTTLRRLNRITRVKFPKYKLQTVSSCSGHVKEDGSLTVLWTPIPELKPLPDYPEIMFYTRSRMHLHEMAIYLREIFDQTVTRVNEKFQEDVITIDEDTKYTPYTSYVNGIYGTLLSEELVRKHPAIKTYSINFNFPVLKQGNAFPVIEQFWTNLEQVLTQIDGLNLHSSFKKEDFVKTNQYI